jgi:hypothetical protein
MTKRSKLFFTFCVAICCPCAVAQGTANVATSTPATTPVLNVFDDSFSRYPSLEPLSAVNVNLIDVPSGTFDALRKASSDPNWNCTSPNIYSVQVVDKTGKPLHTVAVMGVRAQGNTSANVRYTRCDGSGLPPSVLLILGPQVSKNDLLLVSIYSDSAHSALVARSDGKLSIIPGRQFTFNVTPQSAPGESLNNGKKRDTGQLNVSLAETDILPNRAVNLYAKSADLFSTDEKDTKSAFAATLGAQRGLFPRWYSPLHLEEMIQGNQIASNLSATTTMAITTLVPWAWSGKSLNNTVISAPIPPDVTIANSYTRRINQLVTAKIPLLAQNDYSLNPSLSWSSITLPPTCKVFDWLNKSKSGGYCLGLAFDLGLWYLPLDLTSAKTQKAEGYGDATIMLPLAGFNFASKVFPYITSSDPTKVQIQIKYSNSVNAANNYARTRGWTYGLQVLK